MHLALQFNQSKDVGIQAACAMDRDETGRAQFLHCLGPGLSRDGKNSDLHIRQPVYTRAPYGAVLSGGSSTRYSGLYQRIV